MDVLSIGNSFSQDAQRYLHRIAASDGCELSSFNLYIGGCSLSRHYRNMLSCERAYTLEMNGESTGFSVSLKEALLNRDWDIITLQQVSGKSPYYRTYQPYLNKLAEYVREYAPHANLAIHQTWAYEKDSNRLCVELGYKSPKDMFSDIEHAYAKAARATGADIIIPSGAVFNKLADTGVKLYRDTYHASLGAGRYALGLTWYTALTGNGVKSCGFSDFDESVSDCDAELIKKCIDETVEENRICKLN